MQALTDDNEEDAILIVAHEMAGPLQLLALQLAALRRETAGCSEVRRLASMGNAVEALRILARDLLDADRICRGQFEMTFAEQEVTGVAREVVEGFGCIAARRGIAISLSAPPDGITVECDRSRLTQVLTNLVGNAVKFSPNDAAIVVRIVAAEKHVLLSVTNVGPGIPREHRRLIFERRWQAPNERRGHGIGLFVARQIVEQHGGRIWLEETCGRGTTITLALPLRYVRQAEWRP